MFKMCSSGSCCARARKADEGRRPLFSVRFCRRLIGARAANPPADRAALDPPSASSVRPVQPASTCRVLRTVASMAVISSEDDTSAEICHTERCVGLTQRSVGLTRITAMREPLRWCGQQTLSLVPSKAKQEVVQSAATGWMQCKPW